jgi:hypothetical protein
MTATYAKKLRAARAAVVGGALAAGLSALLLPAGPAAAVNAKVRSACADDYTRFCPAYAPESAQARQCMRQVGRRLSQRCIDALEDAGELSRSKRKK